MNNRIIFGLFLLTLCSVCYATTAEYELLAEDAVDAIVPEEAQTTLLLEDSLQNKEIQKSGGINKTLKKIKKAAKKAIEKSQKAAEKKTKEVATKAQKAAKVAYNKALKATKTPIKKATNLIKSVKNAADDYTDTIKKIAAEMVDQSSQFLTVATSLASSIKIGCAQTLNLKIPVPNKINLDATKSGFGKMSSLKIPLCKKPSFEVGGESGNAAMEKVKDMVIDKIKSLAVLVAQKAGLADEEVLVQLDNADHEELIQLKNADFTAHKSGMLLGPKCSGKTWAITITISFGGSVGANGIGADVGFEFGMEFGCMGKMTVGDISKRLVMVPVWGIGCGISGGATGSGASMDLNVAYATSYTYYKAGGLPGGISIGGSVSAGKVGVSASADFDVPPYSIVLKSKKFQGGGKVIGTLMYPKSPFIKIGFTGVGLSYNLASYPPAEVPYNMLQLHKQNTDAVEELDLTQEEVDMGATEFTMDAGWSMGCRRWDDSVSKCFEVTAPCFVNCY